MTPLSASAAAVVGTVGPPPLVPLLGGGGTSLIWFIGFVLLAVLSGYLGYVGYRLYRTAPGSQRTLWAYFGFVGTAGVVTGGIGAFRTTLVEPPVAFAALVPTLLVGYVFACGLTLREAQYNAVFSDREIDRLGEYPTRRGIEVGIVLGIVGMGVPPLFFDGLAPAVLSVVLAPAVIVYGTYFYREHLRGAASQGTLVDTLMRHMLVTLVFYALAGVVTALLLVVPDAGALDSLGATVLTIGGGSQIAVVVKFGQHTASV
ncbi:hypothetical protein RYH80_17405 [Halobaculum sp. MBLA0147]|uniref:hypothetical protein n=1 Tax=Halobaculum sp. MBLA0147 TaxID=3079934 RepID=UPI00352573A3